MVTFSEQAQGANRLITISASDDSSGVGIVRYSLDGVTYQPYTNPITVNGEQRVTVSAIADDNLANRSDIFTYTVSGSPLTALGPARVWVGLKNSDDVGTKFDLLAEVFKNGNLVGSGQLNDVPGGSSGFNNAKLDVMNLAVSTMSMFRTGDVMSVRLSARIAASSGHRSGTARLWFNDAAANSNLTITVDGVTTTYFLCSGDLLKNAPGAGPKNTRDVLVDRAVAGNPFKSFGTWSVTF